MARRVHRLFDVRAPDKQCRAGCVSHEVYGLLLEDGFISALRRSSSLDDHAAAAGLPPVVGFVGMDDRRQGLCSCRAARR